MRTLSNFSFSLHNNIFEFFFFFRQLTKKLDIILELIVWAAIAERGWIFFFSFLYMEWYKKKNHEKQWTVIGGQGTR